MSQPAIADATRISTAFTVEPSRLTIITDPAHPLFDKRSISLGIHEPTVQSIKRFGVRLPVLVRKNGEAFEVIDGRQRTLNAIEANKRLEAEGKPTIKIPVIVQREDDKNSAGLIFMLNAIRQDDGIVQKAENAQHLISNFGYSEEEAGVVFGVSGATIKNWTKLLDLAAPVRKAVDCGAITASAASKLAELPRDQQVLELDKLVAEAGDGKKVSTKSAGKAVDSAKGREGKDKPSPKLLKKIYQCVDVDDATRSIIGWVLGVVTANKADMAEVIALATKPKEKPKKEKAVKLAKAKKSVKSKAS